MTINFSADDYVVVNSNYLENTLASLASRNDTTTMLRMLGTGVAQIKEVGNLTIPSGSTLSYVRVVPTNTKSFVYRGGEGVRVYFSSDNQLNHAFERSTSSGTTSTEQNNFASKAIDIIGSLADADNLDLFSFLTARDGIVYGIANNPDRVVAIDVKDPTSPALLGTTADMGMTGKARGGVLLGKYFFLGDTGGADFRAYDISDPTTPTLAGSSSLSTLDNFFSLSTDGRFIYGVNKGTSPGTFFVLDVSDVSRMEIKGSVTNAAFTDNYTYVEAGGNGFVYCRTLSKLVIVDVSDPSSPSVRGSYDLTAAGASSSPPVHAMAYQDGVCYVSEAVADSSIISVDVTDPDAPTLLQAYSASNPVSYHPFLLKPCGDYLVIADFYRLKILIYNISDPSSMYQVAFQDYYTSSEAPNAYWQGLDVVGDKVYAAMHLAFYVIDLKGLNEQGGSFGSLYSQDARISKARISSALISDAGLERARIGSLEVATNRTRTLEFRRQAVTTNYSTQGDTLLGVDTSTARTITLATADFVAGRTVIIKDETGGAGANNITVATEGSEQIDGAASYTISSNYGSVTLYAGSTQWHVI